MTVKAKIDKIQSQPSVFWKFKRGTGVRFRLSSSTVGQINLDELRSRTIGWTLNYFQMITNSGGESSVYVQRFRIILKSFFQYYLLYKLDTRSFRIIFYMHDYLRETVPLSLFNLLLLLIIMISTLCEWKHQEIRFK